MLAKFKLQHFLMAKRSVQTTPKVGFKFKLTEEIMRQEDERVKKKEAEKVEPEKALHTREGSLIMGRVSHERYKSIVKIAIPKHRFNDFLTMYFRENDDIQVYDENNITKPGDFVLVRRTPKPLDENVEHIVERVVYSYGNYIDPITGRKSLGFYYEDDMKKLERVKIEL